MCILLVLDSHSFNTCLSYQMLTGMYKLSNVLLRLECMENDNDHYYCTLVASSINLSVKLVIHFESTLYIVKDIGPIT